MVITVKVEGLQEIQEALRRLPDATAKNVMKRVLLARAQPVAEAARNLVPVFEGHLKNSIGVSTRLTRRQRGHCPPDQRPLRRNLGQLRRSRSGIERFDREPSAEDGVERPGVAGAGTPPAAADVEPDPGQPRSEPIRPAQPVEVEHGLERGLLGGVLGQVRIAERPLAEGADQRAVAHQQTGTAHPR